MKAVEKIFESFSNENIFKSNLKSYALLKGTNFTERVIASTAIEPYRPPKELFRQLVGKKKIYPENIGNHPDFAHLDEHNSEYHYIVSVFADLKGSTVLATKLPLEDVRFIKNGLLVTAIDIFQVFDGHVHRLQGDAIFALFGRRGISKADAIIDALNATTFLQYYIKNSLSPKFEELGFPPLKLRIGIDFGDDDKVLWTKYGIKNCSEITTTSVHTDLASKLQGRAPANSIMIGDNIVQYLDFPDEFHSVKTFQRDGQPIEDKYVISNEYLNYLMWKFDWEKYIPRFSFMETPNQYPYKSTRDFSVSCFYKTRSEDDYLTEYKGNCFALPKGLDLKFVADIKYHVKFDNILWEVQNRGVEATQAGQLRFPMTCYEKKRHCLQSTAYKGHHYMVFTLKYQDRVIGQDYFGVYVKDA
jgi:adenylate cyclase